MLLTKNQGEIGGRKGGVLTTDLMGNTEFSTSWQTLGKNRLSFDEETRWGSNDWVTGMDFSDVNRVVMPAAIFSEVTAFLKLCENSSGLAAV